jgi:hypothetical protein
MKDIMDKFFSDLRSMPSEEFSRTMSKYANHPIALAFEEIMEFGEGVQVFHKDFIYTSEMACELQKKIMQIDFEQFELYNAANDERFALAA